MSKFPFPSFSGELCKGAAVPGSQQGDQELQQPVSISGKKGKYLFPLKYWEEKIKRTWVWGEVTLCKAERRCGGSE